MEQPSRVRLLITAVALIACSHPPRGVASGAGYMFAPVEREVMIFPSGLDIAQVVPDGAPAALAITIRYTPRSKRNMYKSPLAIEMEDPQGRRLDLTEYGDTCWDCCHDGPREASFYCRTGASTAEPATPSTKPHHIKIRSLSDLPIPAMVEVGVPLCVPPGHLDPAAHGVLCRYR